ncbi:hypothetical protein ACQJBY_054945 [Aegilops geniculata]
MAAAPLLSLTDAATATATAVLAPGRAPARARIQAAPRHPATVSLRCHRARPVTAAAAAGDSPSSAAFHGECFVVGDNIDTDQIIPAEHLTLVPSKPDEYRKLGSFAFVGLPSAAYPIPFVAPGEESSLYAVIIGGANFGCGSSREHAPVALGAAGARAVVAESYARIFFRNSVATGEVYPLELADSGASKECKTGDVVTVDLDNSVLINHTSGKQYKLKPIGDAGPVIEAGGIFAYARKTGMIASKSA